MNELMTNKKAAIGLLFALVLVFAVPAISLAQGRGNGRGQGSNLDKKCAKFVNCHDARDGRWDGRGPAINTGAIPNQPPISYPYPPNSGQNNPIYYPSSRNRQTDRDDEDNNNRSGTWRRRRHDSDTDPNNQNDRRRRRRSDSNNTETRNRRVRGQNRSNVID